MIAICVDFEIDPTNLDAFLSLIQKNASESVANEVGCHQLDIPQNPTKIFLMSFMMMQPLLICINNQAIVLNSIKQRVRWSCRNQFVCCKKSITDIGCSAAKSVATKIRNFLLYIALQKCVRTKAVLRRYFFRTSIIQLNVVR